MYICSFFIPQAKTTELIQPREGTFHDPAKSPQPTTMLGIAHCEQRGYAAGAQSTADVLRVIGPVTQHAIWATARPTTLTLEWRNTIEQS